MSEALPVEPVGLGVSQNIAEDISTAQVWKALLIKIKEPNLFLPVSDVTTRPSDDGRGTYREMSIGPNRMIENIYADEALLEVKFVVEGDVIEHVNIIHAKDGVRTLEFYKRHSQTGERVHWDAPKRLALGGVEKVLEMARTL